MALDTHGHDHDERPSSNTKLDIRELLHQQYSMPLMVPADPCKRQTPAVHGTMNTAGHQIKVHVPPYSTISKRIKSLSKQDHAITQPAAPANLCCMLKSTVM